MNVDLYTDKHYYSAPDALPAGFLEIIHPIAAWFFGELVKAYDNGYNAGRMDETRIQLKAIDLNTSGKRCASRH